MAIRIDIAQNFSRTPGPRSRDEGDFSGQQFREDLLWPQVKDAIAQGHTLTINLDGTAGYGTSFLEEAFGGLIREHGLSYEQLRATLTFESNEESYLPNDIDGYMKDAQANR